MSKQMKWHDDYCAFVLFSVA